MSGVDGEVRFRYGFYGWLHTRVAVAWLGICFWLAYPVDCNASGAEAWIGSVTFYVVIK